MVGDGLQDAWEASRKAQAHSLDRGEPFEALNRRLAVVGAVPKTRDQLLFAGSFGVGQEVAGLISKPVPGNRGAWAESLISSGHAHRVPCPSPGLTPPVSE